MNSPESRRIENILASISDCFYALDKESRFIYLNPQAEEYFGRTSAELMGRVVWDEFPEARGTIFEREYKRVMENGGRSRFETRSVATGKWIEMTIYAQPKDPAIIDGGGGLAVYFRDVTQARELERQSRERADYYRLLVENAREYAIVGLDLAGVITHWNEGAKRIFGWDEQQAIGQNLRLFFLPEDIKNEIPEKEMVQAAKTGRANDERVHLRADGTTFWALGDMMALYEEDGALRGYMKILRDNTERRNAEDEIRRVQLKLRDTQEWLKKVADEVGISFWVWQPETDEITYQNALDQFFGASFASFAGFKEFLHPDDRDRVGNVVTRAISLVEDYELEFRVRRHPDSRPENEADWKWALSVVSAQKNEGEPLTLFGINLDITARKQAQLQLQVSQRRLRSVAREARVAIWVWDPVLDVIHEKFMLDELLGYDVTRFEQFSDRTHPDDVEPTAKCARHVVEKGENAEVTFRLQNVDNPDTNRVEDWRWFLCKMSPGGAFESQTGGLIESQNLIYGFTIDITEERIAQENVLRSEKRYATLVEETGAMIWRANPDLSEMEMPGWYQITGQRDEDLKTRWPEVIHPGDQERVVETWKRALEKSEGFEITYRLRHRDGQFRFNTGRAIPIFEPDGTLREWVGTNTNTDEILSAQHALRESERRYRTLIDASPQIVWESAPDGTVLYGNQFWARYCNLSQQQIQQNGWRDCVHPDDMPLIERVWSEALSGKNMFEHEMRLWCEPLGEWRWHLSRSIPICDEKGEIEKWIGSSVEIHERKLADQVREQILQDEQKARKSAEAASRQKDEFLAIVSHELRTPLNAILGWSNLLRTGELPGETQLEGLQVIERNARAQAQIVDDILDVARVINGKLKMERRALDLGELVRETLESLSLSAHSRGVEVVGNYLALPVVGDPTRLRQVFWNLLSNALKFTSNGGRITVSMRAENGMAVVEIQDDGIGIEAEFLPHVFDRFRQADSSSTRRHGGLGLGLALVYSIVNAHGGTVEATSPGIGQGAVFTIRLVLNREAMNLPSPQKTGSAGKRLDGRRILVVDDARDTLELTELFLRREGASVEGCDNVADAKARFVAHNFDLVVTDLAMPKADGYDFLHWIRTQNGTIPVVAVTAFAGREEKRRVEDAGFNDFVSKPLEANHLIETLQKFMK